MAKGAGLSVGVTHHDDPALARLPAAADSARRIVEALDLKLVRDVRVIADPTTNGDLYLAVQRAAQEAKGGDFFFYFAGHALRRGDELLLAVRESELEGTRGCVPWSDIEDLLTRSKVGRALLLLNVNQITSGAARGLSVSSAYHVMGSLRDNDPIQADTRLRGYADAIIEALQRPAVEISAYLSEDGKLNAEGIGRYLAAAVPKAIRHEVWSSGAEALVLRDLAADLARTADAAKEPAGAPETTSPPITDEAVKEPPEPSKKPEELEAKPAPLEAKEPEAKAAPIEVRREEPKRTTVYVILALIVLTLLVLWYLSRF